MSQDSIGEFQERVRSLITSVSSITNSSFQKAVYLVMIDGLSYYRFAEDRKKARDRFVDFINTYGNWPECRRVSLPQAEVILSETPGADKVLLAEISDRLACWDTASEHDVTDDPLPEDLPDHSGILTDCQHGRLLWAFRNTLFHEFRHPGSAFYDDFNSKFPHYEMDLVERERSGKHFWELVMPAEFLKQLSFNCLDGLAGWFRSEGKDPQSIGYQGRSWVTRLRKLNTPAAGGAG